MNAYDYATSFNTAVKHDAYGNSVYKPKFTDEAIAHYKNHDDPVFYPDVDWYPYMFDKVSAQTQHNINISGGTEKVKYFVSGGYFNQEGLMNHTDLNTDYDGKIRYNRYNVRSNFDIKVTKRLSATINLATTIEKRSGSNAEPTSIFNDVWATNPVDRPLPSDTDGKYVILPSPAGAGGGPLFGLLSYGYKRDFRTYLNGSIRLNYLLDFITEGLSAHATANYNSFHSQVINYSKPFVTYKAIRLADQSLVYIPQNEPGAFGYNETSGKNRREYFEAGIDYAKSFGDHNFTGLINYNQGKKYDPNIKFLVPNAVQGIVGRVTYDYKQRYLVEFNVCYNGTENFAAGKRFGFFPAYSLGWVPSRESFFPENDIITLLKFRGSYGETGNERVGDISIATGNRFLFRPTPYTSTNNVYYFGQDVTPQGYPGMYEGTFGNPDVTWERKKALNLGTEINFFKDALKITVDYFSEKRDNILAKPEITPNVFGGNLPVSNLGRMSNSGYELDATFNNKIGSFNYWVKGNFSFAHNTIDFKAENTYPDVYRNLTGQRVGQLYGWISEGFFNSWEEVNDVNRPAYPLQTGGTTKMQPGDIKYKDVNGDGKIDYGDQVPIGYSSFPEKIFGFSLGGNIKGFDFSVLFQGSGNVSIAYHRNYTSGFLATEGRNAPDYLIESWSQDRLDKGLPINYPRLNQGAAASLNNNNRSDFWIRDASYVRLKNVEFGYSFSEKLLNKVGMSNLRLFVNGSNLYTWSKMLPGSDPESTVNQVTTADDVSNGNLDSYPVTATVNFGINVKF